MKVKEIVSKFGFEQYSGFWHRNKRKHPANCPFKAPVVFILRVTNRSKLRLGKNCPWDFLKINPLIYAAGDVVDQRYKLETLAAREGSIIASN